jgi:ring-1,2-phenylacetyl-CoA epoxidase subunit PaaD
MVNTQEIWALLEHICDPEVPVLSIIDLGIVRDVDIKEGLCTITITPTYSGCPAMNVIKDEIILALSPIIKTNVIKTLSPAWTTDWMSENGKKKLRDYGIAPPENEIDINILFSKSTIVPCPKCDSRETKLISQFGSTSCKAHYQCKYCLEPFDYFKCLR